jgi:hypothetical protein
MLVIAPSAQTSPSLSNLQAIDSPAYHFFAPERTPHGAAIAICIARVEVALQHLLVQTRNGLPFCLCKACRASVCGIGRVEVVNDGVYQNGLLMDCHG